MSTSPTPVLTEGTYWIRNQQLKTVAGLGTSGSASIVEKQEEHSPRQRLADRSQMWLVEILPDGQHFYIRNSVSGRVMDLMEPDAAHGSLITLTGVIAGLKTQQWKIEWIGDYDTKITAYCVVNAHNGTVLDQAIVAAGQPIWSSTYHGRQNQRWFFEPAFLPTVVWIQHVRTGWYVQYDPTAANGIVARNKLPAANNSRTQLWFLEPRESDEGFVIRSLEDDTKVLDLAAGSLTDGTPILAYTFHGGINQSWKFLNVDSDDNLPDPYSANHPFRLANGQTDTMAQVVEGAQEGTLQAFRRNDSNNAQQWRVLPYPFPPLYWTTIQNTKTGTFIAQNDSSAIPSSGARNALDYRVQWRFIPEPSAPHNFSVVNRSTGWIVIGRSVSTGSSVLVAERYRGERGYLWAMERDREQSKGFAVMNTISSGALDHYAGGDTIQAYLNNGTNDPFHHWVNIQVSSSRLPSFALVNSRTGRSLTYITTGQPEGDITTTADTIDSFTDQWLFENLNADATGDPVYAIISKISGNVLDHWGGRRLAAYNDDTVDRHHRWRLVPCPCGEAYFQIANVQTGRFLEERTTGSPNANATGPAQHPPTDEHRAQCWELVTARYKGFDLFIMDDDVLRGVPPYLQTNDSSELEHRIMKRSPGKEKKGKKKDAHIPQNPRLLTDFSPVIGDIFRRVIDQWEDDVIQTTARPGTRVSTNRTEVERDFRITIPPALRRRADEAGWIRIDIQGTYLDTSGQRVANIQGQWLESSVFHVIVPVGERVGRDIIRRAMRQSLEEHTSVIVQRSNSTPPAGGSKPGKKPPPPPGPSGGSGNGWVIYVVAALALPVMLSPLGL